MHSGDDVNDQTDCMIAPVVSGTTMSNENDIDSVLESIEQVFEHDDDVRTPVSEHLAKIVRTMAKETCLMKRNQKCEKHKHSKTCKILVVPRMNPETCSILDHNVKALDLHMQKTHKTLLQATYAVTKVCDSCVASTSLEMKSLVKEMADAISLTLKTVHELSLERHAKILNASNVNRRYQTLASGDIQVTENLFSNDLKSAFAAIDSISKLGMSFSQSSKGRKFFPKNPKKNWEWGKKNPKRGRAPDQPEDRDIGPTADGIRGQQCRLEDVFTSSHSGKQ